MEWFSASDAWLARWLVERGLAVTYLVAFAVVIGQFRPLLGERGLLPVPRYLTRVGFGRSPSLFHLAYSDRLATGVGWVGVVIAASLVLGLPQAAPLGVSALAWLVLWALYLSVVNVGQIFYGFGWESLLLEAGFLAIFLGNAETQPPLLVMLLVRWLAFRVEFGAGLIKIRGDPCWRDLTCLEYHHETQPMPSRFSWSFHHLPRRLHRVETFANHVAQLVVPFLLFAPQPIATVAAGIIVVTQLWLMGSGNFSWLNLLTITLALAAVDGSLIAGFFPIDAPATLATDPVWHQVAMVAVFVVVVVLSYQPVRNLVSKRQKMNASFDSLHLVNTYGAFGSITRTRDEIVVEGTDALSLDGAVDWYEYEFKAKPGDPWRRPRQIAPYHLRLDWLMWFAALSPAYARGWFERFCARLLEGDRATLRLLAHNPFPDEPPTFVRARRYRYRYTTPEERRATGAWWHRGLVGEFYRPMARREAAPGSEAPRTRGSDLG